MKKIEIGDKVKAISETEHKKFPKFYPPVGTIGTVVNVFKNAENRLIDVDVQWPAGTTARGGIWMCPAEHVELVDDENNKEDVIMSKFEIGNKVKAISEEQHVNFPMFYPKVGTIGEITAGPFPFLDLEIPGMARIFGSKLRYGVKWPEGSTSGDDDWLALVEEVIKDETSGKNDDLKEVCKFTHQFFSGLVESGFDVSNALILTGAFLNSMVSEAGKMASNPKEEDK